MNVSRDESCCASVPPAALSQEASRRPHSQECRISAEVSRRATRAHPLPRRRSASTAPVPAGRSRRTPGTGPRRVRPACARPRGRGGSTRDTPGRSSRSGVGSTILRRCRSAGRRAVRLLRRGRRNHHRACLTIAGSGPWENPASAPVHFGSGLRSTY